MLSNVFIDRLLTYHKSTTHSHYFIVVLFSAATTHLETFRRMREFMSESAR